MLLVVVLSSSALSESAPQAETKFSWQKQISSQNLAGSSDISNAVWDQPAEYSVPSLYASESSRNFSRAYTDRKGGKKKHRHRRLSLMSEAGPWSVQSENDKDERHSSLPLPSGALIAFKCLYHCAIDA